MILFRFFFFGTAKEAFVFGNWCANINYVNSLSIFKIEGSGKKTVESKGKLMHKWKIKDKIMANCSQLKKLFRIHSFLETPANNNYF